jgi:peptide/nickel transport system ATP-binding protein
MSGALLEIKGLTTEVLTLAGPRRLVEEVSFSIVPEEVLAIVGESGSGKSVTMLSALGLLPEPVTVTAGSVRFEGLDLLRLAERDLRRIRGDRIGMIFQEPMSALNPVTTVGAQVAEPLVVHRNLSRKAAWAEAVRLLDRVRIPQAGERARLYPHQLSGGMRQRVVIAAAIACKPKLLIADEPTTALDATVQAEIMVLLTELRRDIGCAIALITHDMGLVKDVADRIVVMNRGRVVEQGLQGVVFAAPRSAYTRTLLKAAFLSTAAEGGAPTASPAVLDVKDVTVSFGVRAHLFSARRGERLHAVDGVSFSLKAGETLALVGESGSGKTTLARSVLGLAPIDEGGIWIDGRDARNLDAANRKVQFVFQDPQASLDPRLRVWESAIEPLALAATERKTALRARAVALLADVGLGADHLDRFPHELSGGQRQRIGIARALSVSPRILIADEAVSALDASTRLQVLDLLAALQRRTGVAMLFITHDFGVVSRLAHRVAVMRFGRIVEIGRTAEVLNHPAHAYTKTLLAAVPGRGDLGKAGPSLSSKRHRSGRRGTLAAWPPLESIGPDHAAVHESPEQ